MFALLKSVKVLTIILVTIIATVLAVSIITHLFSKPSTQIDLSRDSVIKEIQSLGRLETASYSIEKIVEAGQDGNVIQDLLYGDKLLLIANGKVTAGVDLINLKKEAIEVNGEILSINLPPPTIFNSSLDSSKTKVYDRDQGYLTRGNKDLESEARKSAEASIREAACGAGILEEARTNAIERIKVLFRFAGFTTVEVNIPSGSC